MTDPGREVRSRRACVLAAMVLAGLLPVGCSGGWFSPFDTRVTRPSELYAFLQSPRQHVTGVSVNGHRLQIGKRPSLQVLPGYGRPMFQVRPKGRIQSKYRSL
ncbi:MAG TPA: hypothetical protein PLW83_00205, partial [Deltaproteobacteria bacterium]|nr:hypothetical protein [Deltaproteobacteria bacterium]